VVLAAKFDRYRCPHCYVGLSALSQKARGDAFDESQIASYELHVRKVKTMAAEYQKHKNNLQSNQLLVLFDYTTVHEIASEYVSDFAYFQMRSVMEVNFCLRGLKRRILGAQVFYRYSNNELAYEFFDFHVDGRMNGDSTTSALWMFFQTNWIKQRIKNGVKHFIFWSDGGERCKELVTCEIVRNLCCASNASF